LIAGLGMEEALRRARAYAAAGADAVLVHSKAADFAELRDFASRWDGGVPLVAVPTTYPTVAAEELEAAGFRMAIFANQALRAAIVAMRDALGEIRRSGKAVSVEDRIAPLDDVYALVGVPELKANEQRFLFAGDKPPRAVILAAGFDPQLLPLIEDRPKTMLDVKGRTILERQVAALNGAGITDITVVRGYKKEHVKARGVRFVDNDRYRETGELYSLFRAEEALGGPFLFLYGDIIFEAGILEKLLRAAADVAVVVDRAFHDAHKAGIPLPPGPLDLVVTETPPNGRRFVAPESGSRVVRIGPEVGADEAHGEFIGMAAFSARGAALLRTVHAELAAARAEGIDKATVPQVLQALIDRGQPITAVDIHKGWMEIDSFDDYRRAWMEAAP
jgi:phosphoenolpyruvate phosphomutase